MISFPLSAFLVNPVSSIIIVSSNRTYVLSSCTVAMSASRLLSLSKAGAQTLLADDYGHSIHSIGSDQILYRLIEPLVDASLVQSEHSFHLESLEVACASITRSMEFKRRLSLKSDFDTYFLFHGTKPSNHDSIFDKGFLEEHFGDTDKGYIGRGVYLSPHVEYSASYIKDTAGITRFKYNEPVQVGVTCQILGCVAIVGTTKCVQEILFGSEIPSYLDSHWAWVNSAGNPTGDSGKHFAVEYVVRETHNIYPRFRLRLKRVTLELVWVDPNITNAENSGHVTRLKNTGGMFLYATSNASKALKALTRSKVGTEYRAMTAGSGGEAFVGQLRASGVHCRVLVFCNAVDYHKTWARKYSNVHVTRVVSEVLQFATWQT